MAQAPFTFLQLSDVHLDSLQNQGLLSYGAAQRGERYADLVEAFVNALRLARENSVDAVFIPGGLWNHDTIRAETAGTVLEAIEEVKPIPVFITPGDSDPYLIDSPYNSQYLEARGIRDWPDNAYIFRSTEYVSIPHPTRSDVAIAGVAYTDNEPIEYRLLEEPLAKDEQAAINVLLYHGSLDAYSGVDRQRVTAPFSAEELDRQGYTYTCLGHYHEYTEVYSEDDRLLGAYSGCLSGRNFEEIGPRAAILGTITLTDEGEASVTLEPVEVARNRIMYISVDVSGLDYDTLKEEIVIALEEQEVRPDEDIVALSIEGHFASDTDPHDVIADIYDEFYRLIIVDRTRPDYLSEDFDPRTTEAAFVESMMDRMQKAREARAAGEAGDSLTGLPAMLSGKTVEDALYYGLDALKQKKVRVRHVD